MASPKTIAANKRAARIQAESLARISKERGLGPVPRTARRWVGRTKGQPYSRMRLVDTIPGEHGMPATFVLKHPTRATKVQRKRATPGLIATFYPSIPEHLAAGLLGR